ncbi:MAG: phospholipid carrier-dependent glycosyltransferase [Kofleriaceae bacterium]
MKPALAIWIAVFSLYLLTSSREPAWGDAHPMWAVAERLVDHGHIDIKTRWPDDIPLGRDNKIYGIAPIGPAVMHVPGAALMAVTHRFAPAQDPLVKPLATHLGPSALGALAAVVFFLLLGDLGIRRRTASACTAILVLATTTWVYAHYPYSEILQLATFLGLFRATLRVANDPSRREALWWGAWAGMAFNSKYVVALAVIGAAIVIAWTLRARRDELKRAALWAAVSGAPFLIVALAYNYARWGDVTATGYGPYLGAFFGGSVFDGAWGMLASPNKSAFLYSPPLVLALLGAPAAFRAVPRLGLAMLAMCVPTFVVYCTYRSWSGDYAWGPRFFVWLVPVLLVPMAWCVDRFVSRWQRGFVAAVVAAGLCVQLLGISLYWDHYIRVAIAAKNQWLGNPNRKGSYIAERGRGHCDSCFEDTYELTWTPAFQPIRGQWWLLKSLVRDDDAVAAQADAPWRTYTSLDLDLARDWGRTRLDWWVMLWWKDAPATQALGLVMLILLLGGTGFGASRWVRYHRRANHDAALGPEPA